MRLVVVILALSVAGAVVVGLVLSWWQASSTAPLIDQAGQMANSKERIAALKDLAQYQTDYQVKLWTTIFQIVGGLGLVATGYFSWRNLRVTQEGQITNRFTEAVAQLGAELKDGKPNL